MTSSKKVLGLLLALAMVFGCMTMAFAADPGAANRAATVKVTASADALAAGETATITVSATTNFTAATVSIPVFYNKNLVSVSNVVTAAASVAGVATVATDATAANADLVYANSGYDAANYGFVLVQFTAAQGATVADTLNNTTLFTFTVTAKADVQGEAAIVVPAASKKTTSNANGKLYFGCSTSGTTITKVAENVENIDVTAAAVTLSVGASAEPVLAGINGGVVDADRMYVYGVPAGTTDLAGYFTVTDGSFTVDGEGTGATLTVLDSKGATFATYTLIIFGDVNGDNGITNADLVAIKGVTAGGTIEDAAQAFAADVNGDGGITNADAVAIKGVTAGGTITANPYAA